MIHAKRFVKDMAIVKLLNPMKIRKHWSVIMGKKTTKLTYVDPKSLIIKTRELLKKATLKNYLQWM